MGTSDETSGPQPSQAEAGFSVELRLRDLRIASKRSRPWNAVYRNPLRKCMECSCSRGATRGKPAVPRKRCSSQAVTRLRCTSMRGDILLRLQAKAELAVSEYQLALAGGSQ